MAEGICRDQISRNAMSNAAEPEIKITEGTKAVINDPGVVATAEISVCGGRITSPALRISADEVIEIIDSDPISS